MSIVIDGGSTSPFPSSPPLVDVSDRRNLVVPGASVSTMAGFMRGHGTYLHGSDLVASVAGRVEQVNKLICVRPVKSRYTGEIGDVVIGRITEVQQKRWKVDTNSRQDSVLLLSSVNLPGGELRRKSLEDELMMREYLREGDLISAEVQQTYHDGSLSLHTRNLRYGKLSQGLLMKVCPYLVRRRKTHFHNLPCGAALILGCNGYVWISPIGSEDESLSGGYVQNLDQIVAMESREVISRLGNCVSLLAEHNLPLYDTTITHAFDFSSHLQVKELLQKEVAAEICAQVKNAIISFREK